MLSSLDADLETSAPRTYLPSTVPHDARIHRALFDWLGHALSPTMPAPTSHRPLSTLLVSFELASARHGWTYQGAMQDQGKWSELSGEQQVSPAF